MRLHTHVRCRSLLVTPHNPLASWMLLTASNAVADPSCRAKVEMTAGQLLVGFDSCCFHSNISAAVKNCHAAFILIFSLTLSSFLKFLWNFLVVLWSVWQPSFSLTWLVWGQCPPNSFMYLINAYTVHTLILKAVGTQATCQEYAMQAPNKSKAGMSGCQSCPLQKKKR